MTPIGSRAARVPREGFIPLFWRLFIPNATVLAAACVVLIIEPANGRIPALVGGLILMLTVNLLLMRRAVAPLSRLMAMMEQVDPLEPGRRLSVQTAESEVTALTESFNRMLERLESERRESGHRALAAQESERRRVAAELHDEIGQQLTAHLLQLDRIGKAAAGELAPQLEQATTDVKQTLEDVRTLAHRLRPEVLDELGLVPALRNLCDQIGNSTQLIVHRTLPATLPRLTDEQELVIYRVAQESLTNIVRHAHANTAHVTLHHTTDALQLRIQDDGNGIPAPASEQAGGGLRSLRERALTIDAKLHVTPADSGGTTITLHLPTHHHT